MSQPDNEGPRSVVPAVARAAAILDALAAANGQPLGPSELSRQLGIAKSSVANLCQALVDAGLAQRADTGYRLGRRLAHLGAAYLATVDIVREFYDSLPELDDLPETLQLAILTDELEVVYLARRDGTSPVKLASEIGRNLPANCTATGKVMLASLPAEEVDRRLEGVSELPALTSRSITEPEQLHAELQRVAERGYAVDDEEVVDGVVCLAKAVYAGSLGGPAAVSVTVLKASVTIDHLEHLVERLELLVKELDSRLSGARHLEELTTAPP